MLESKVNFKTYYVQPSKNAVFIIKKKQTHTQLSSLQHFLYSNEKPIQ